VENREPLNELKKIDFMKDFMKVLLFLIGVPIVALCIGYHFEAKRNPYEEGMHMDYMIRCENGFVYKTLSNRQGTIQIFNSDGTPLRCGNKIH
jgi:hypothetical protein